MPRYFHAGYARSRAMTLRKARRRYARKMGMGSRGIGYPAYKRGSYSRYYRKSLPSLSTELKIFDSFCSVVDIRKVLSLRFATTSVNLK